MRNMKHSGIKWIGEIPENWEIRKGKYCLNYVEKPVKETDDVITCFRDGTVTLRKNRREDGFTVSEKEIGYQGIDIGDLVVHGMDGFSGSIGISDSRGKASPVLNVLETENNKLFMMYYLRSLAYRGVFLALSTGIRVRTCDTNWGKLKELSYLLPPIEEQKKIAEYIDYRCKIIDNLIEKTQQTIDDYRRLRQSIITKSIVNGVEQKGKLKDSGIEWIGKICDKYSVKKLKYLIIGPLIYGANETGEPYEEKLPRYIRITDITKDGKLKAKGKLSLSESASDGYILEDGDVLLARSGASVGKAFIYRKEYGRSAYAGYLIKAKTNEGLLPEYLFFFTQSSLYEEWKKQIFVQATIQNISAEKYCNLPIVLGTIDQQQEIVSYLENKCKIIDKIIDEKDNLIGQLDYYKKSVIYEYVTGKKEVPA